MVSLRIKFGRALGTHYYWKGSSILWGLLIMLSLSIQRLTFGYPLRLNFRRGGISFAKVPLRVYYAQPSAS